MFGLILLALPIYDWIAANNVGPILVAFVGSAAVCIGIAMPPRRVPSPNIHEAPPSRDSTAGKDLRLARRPLLKPEALRGGRDVLTGLLGQEALKQVTEMAIVNAQSRGRKLCLISFDIDRLKDINGCFGFEAGDAVLAQTGARLGNAGADIAVRLGADRFSLLFTDIPSGEAAEVIAANCLDRIGIPIMPTNEECVEITPTASAGVALFPDHGDTFAMLFRHAEMAVDTAKRSGGRRCCMFQNSMVETLKRRRSIEFDLKRAIDHGDLHLVFQPQIDLGTGLVFGAEALMRWTDPKKGSIPPSVFIPVAESTGLIRPLGQWLIEEACRCAQQWRQEHLDLVLAINISTAQLRQHDLIDSIAKALSDHRLDPGNIELELTESLFVDPAELLMRRTLDNLARMGVKLAIDDFGTGFSSLAYLKRLPVSKIKIDKSFINGVGRGKVDEALIRTIIGLGRTFDKTVLAEGIEEKHQLQFLQAEGCHQAQGYYFARPLSFDACSDFARRRFSIQEPVENRRIRRAG